MDAHEQRILQAWGGRPPRLARRSRSSALHSPGSPFPEWPDREGMRVFHVDMFGRAPVGMPGYSPEGIQQVYTELQPAIDAGYEQSGGWGAIVSVGHVAIGNTIKLHAGTHLTAWQPPNMVRKPPRVANVHIQMAEGAAFELGEPILGVSSLGGYVSFDRIGFEVYFGQAFPDYGIPEVTQTGALKAWAIDGGPSWRVEARECDFVPSFDANYRSFHTVSWIEQTGGSLAMTGCRWHGGQYQLVDRGMVLDGAANTRLVGCQMAGGSPYSGPEQYTHIELHDTALTVDHGTHCGDLIDGGDRWPFMVFDGEGAVLIANTAVGYGVVGDDVSVMPLGS